MWNQIFEASLFVIFAFGAGPAQQLSTAKFDSPIILEESTTAVNSSGTILIVDVQSDNVREVQDGKTVREHLHPPYSRAVLVAFGPEDERYLLFHGPDSAFRIQVYAADGQRNREISLPKPDFSPLGLQVDSHGQILLLRDSKRTPPGENLIYKLDPVGNLVTSFFPNPAQGDERRNMPRMVVGANDELALFIPELQTVYWLDRNGSLVRTASVSSRVTAVGLVDDELWIAGADESPLPASKPGVYSSRLSTPVLHRISRNGSETRLPLPRELAGANHIDRHGNLILLTSKGVTTLRR